MPCPASCRRGTHTYQRAHHGPDGGSCTRSRGVPRRVNADSIRVLASPCTVYAESYRAAPAPLAPSALTISTVPADPDAARDSGVSVAPSGPFSRLSTIVATPRPSVSVRQRNSQRGHRERASRPDALLLSSLQ